ncbi:MAG TPA: carboxymuconolactone decarboxylase family protein [Nitrospirae bacterium]|nr:carboxymuconolactone decarboxylase family protein [Nitrospirota bacterium]
MAKVPQQQKYFTALENLGKTIKSSGPLDEKTSQLIKIAVSTAIRSEGAVHSHTRRALELGASAEEIYHAILLTTSTIGFPNVSAGLSWADNLIEKS